MSIEQNLADLTAAVNNLTAVLQSKLMAGTIGNSAIGHNDDAERAAMQAARNKAEQTKKPQAEKAASAAPHAATEPSTTKAPTDAAAGGKQIDFTSQIQKPIVAMGAKGPNSPERARALAILKELGAARASEIKPEDYAKALELIAKAG
jgi:hypothetical protein